jgi:cation transport regulator ChaC
VIEVNKYNYFAYGSNMDENRLKERIGEFERGKVAFLKGYRLVFDKSADSPQVGYANIISHKEKTVIGVLYELTDKQLLILDDYEGIAHNQYKRGSVNVWDERKQSIEAITYLATDCESDLKPYKWYLDYLINGAEQHYFPNEYLKMLKAVKTANDK